MKPKLFIAATGAGAGAQERVWSTPGCSQYFTGACFPYGHEQLADFLGHRLQQSCSEDTALEMATMAYYHATDRGCPAVGVGLSAAVASAEPRRGENRIHAAVMTDDGAWRSTIPLRGREHGSEARRDHGQMADDLIMDLVEHPRSTATDTARATELFLANGYWSATGTRSAVPPDGRSMFPGAFNPPHEGHFGMAAKERAVFWVEAQAPNKPPLTLAEMVKRAKMLKGHDRFFTSGYPLYTDKSTFLPGRRMVVGADAALRMFDPAWGPPPEEVAFTLNRNGTTLVLAARKVGERMVDVSDVLPKIPSGICLGLIDGHWDISSTALRASAEPK